MSVLSFRNGARRTRVTHLFDGFDLGLGGGHAGRVAAQDE